MKIKKKSLIVNFSNNEASFKSKSEEFGSAFNNVTVENDLVKEGCYNEQKEFAMKIDQQRSFSCAASVRTDLIKKWEEDQTVLSQQKERIHVMMEENHHYLSSIATLKIKLKEACHEFESLSKYVKMLTSLDNRMGLGFSENSSTSTSSTVFIRASSIVDHETGVSIIK